MKKKATVSWETKRLVAQKCLDTFRLLGVPELIPHLTIDWSNRFTRRLGDALYTKNYRKYGMLSKARVRFSVPLWVRASEEERHEVVIHEICHIVVTYQNGGKPLRKGRRRDVHGDAWKTLMLRCGLNPSRCHNVDREGLKRTRKTVKAHCPCQTHMVTPNMAKKIQNGAIYACSKCRGRLAVLPKNRVGRKVTKNLGLFL